MEFESLNVGGDTKELTGIDKLTKDDLDSRVWFLDKRCIFETPSKLDRA